MERLLCNGELPPGSSPSQSTLAESILDTASLLPIPDSDMSWEPTPSSQSFYPGAEQENWASYQTQPTVPRIVTKLMPYRLRKVDPGLREDEVGFQCFSTKAASSPCLLSGEAGASQADQRRKSGS